MVGLATARALAVRRYNVTVIEAGEKAVGASIRNFGMIWPIGQPSGELYQRALLSKSIWKEVSKEAGIWYEEAGSLHTAYSDEEQTVLEEFYEAEKAVRPCAVVNKEKTLKIWESVQPEGLRLSLYCKDEMIVDPRQAIGKLAYYLKERYGVRFIWSAQATKVFHPTVWCGGRTVEADEIFICTGADFKALFPERFAALPLTKCKLQMMRTEAQPDGWRLGPALCGGLSLIHYKGFEAAGSLKILKKKFEAELPEYLKWGIHVMASQTQNGQLTIGDSHEYGQTFEPFDKTFINELVLSYLARFARVKRIRIAETWNGIYPKLTDGRTEVVLHPQNGVNAVNGLGGAGMTLSFGLCEQVVSGSYKNHLSNRSPFSQPEQNGL